MTIDSIKSAINASPNAVHYALTVAAKHNFVLGGESFGTSLLNWWDNNGDWTAGQLNAARNMLLRSYLPLLHRHEIANAKPAPVVHENVANLGEEIDF